MQCNNQREETVEKREETGHQVAYDTKHSTVLTVHVDSANTKTGMQRIRFPRATTHAC